MNRTLLILYLVMLSLLSLGCEAAPPPSDSPLAGEPCDYVLLIAVDRDNVEANADVFDFILRVLDRYFHDRIGGHDQVIIAELSGNNRPLIFQGTPQALREKFPDSKAFREYLLAHGTKGKRINTGIAEALEYLMQTYSVAKGNAESVALILSDMNDDQPGQNESDRRLMNALTTYARKGNLGFYFCDQIRMADIRQKMEQAGFQFYTLECDAFGRPPLPNFESRHQEARNPK